MKHVRFWSLAVFAAALVISLTESDCEARGGGRGGANLQRDEEQQEAERIEWAEFSGPKATEKARLVLFAANSRTVEDIAFRRAKLIEEIRKQGLITQVIYPPERAKNREKYRKLCADYGVKRLPCIVFLTARGKAIAALPLNYETLLQALRLLPSRLKELAQAAEGEPKAEKEREREREGEGQGEGDAAPGGDGGDPVAF